MLMSTFQASLLNRIKPYLISSIEKGMKELLETKHLYQNIKIEVPGKGIIQEEIKQLFLGTTNLVTEVIDETTEFIYLSIPKLEWEFSDSIQHRRLPTYVPESEAVYVSIDFTPPRGLDESGLITFFGQKSVISQMTDYALRNGSPVL